jgi:hypothetical protein
VRHEDHRDPELRSWSSLAADVEHLALHDDVERRDRFVRDDELGLECERERDRHALTHAPENWCG